MNNFGLSDDPRERAQEQEALRRPCSHSHVRLVCPFCGRLVASSGICPDCREVAAPVRVCAICEEELPHDAD